MLPFRSHTSYTRYWKNWCSIVSKKRRVVLLSILLSIVVLLHHYVSLQDSIEDLQLQSSSFPNEELTRNYHFRPGQIKELCTTDSGGEKTIIFIETSGENCLRPRQACAIESAALTNPDMSINVYMALDRAPGEPESDKGDGLERHCKTMELLESYSNVRVIREDLSKHLLGTPIEPIYLDGLLTQSQYADQHFSDALRVALLYKHGGIYLDLDTVVLRSLRCLRNTMGHILDDEKSSIENGVMIFDSNHPFLINLMKIMVKKFNAFERMSIGPHSTTATFQMMCNHPSELINNYKHDYGCPDGRVYIRLFNRTAFYPLGFWDRKLYYFETFPPEMLSQFAQTYSIHFYMSGHGVNVPETSFFAYVAKNFCPSVYHGHELGIYKF